MMDPVWQPGIALRFVDRDNGFGRVDRILQQVWIKNAYNVGTYKWENTGKHRWEDVPLMPEVQDDGKYWTKPE